MKRKLKGLLSLLLLCVFMAGIFTACADKEDTADQDTANQADDTGSANNETGNETGENEPTESAGETEALSGTITMVGSTSMEKLANAAAEAFMAKYPNVTVSAEFIGSSAGIEALLAGTADIGNSSRNLEDSEKSAGAAENIVAIDGIAIVLDNSNTVTNLTKEQLIQIYTGEINNWNAVGGADQPIVVVGRESGSGTRGAFEELLEIEDKCKYSNEINSTGGVLAKVASTIGAIGYVSLDVVDNSVVAVKVDDVEPTEENIKAGSYLLSRPFVMATVGEISEQNELVQAFFEYIYSEEGKELIKSVGLILPD